MPGRLRVPGWSPWWPRTSRLRRTSAGAPSATTRSSGDSSWAAAGCGSLNWPPASCGRGAISWASPEQDPGVTTSELHVVDLETGTARDLGRIGTGARSPVWWQADGCWHLAYLAMPEPFGGDAVYDVVVSAAGAVDRDLTAGMAVCPTELAQVADGPPLALFADGLDTAIYRLDPDLPRVRGVAALDGPARSPPPGRSG